MTPPDSLISLARRLARRYSAPGHTAEDLESEAYLTILESAAKHDPAQGRSLADYAESRVRRRLGRLCRRAARQAAKETAPGDDHADRSDPEGEVERADFWRAAESILSPCQFRVLRMTADGHTTAEIADSLGVTIASVATLKNRAKLLLRNRLPDEE